jgi:hypothetical protein
MAEADADPYREDKQANIARRFSEEDDMSDNMDDIADEVDDYAL